MVTIGLGRQDPRQWVKAAYAVTDAMQRGQTGPHAKLPARIELARILGVHYQTVARAYQELAGMGIIYLVPATATIRLRSPAVTPNLDFGAWLAPPTQTSPLDPPGNGSEVTRSASHAHG